MNLAKPRFEDGRPLLIAGFAGRYTPETAREIPQLWERFGPDFGKVPGQAGMVGYGLIYDGDDKGAISYLAGVEVTGLAALPASFSHLRIPAQRYAVFRHDAHVSKLGEAAMAIFSEWFPGSGRKHAAGNLSHFERYDEDFDPAVPVGHTEIWVPVMP